ncbi:NAD-dependent epimerase/dehydratase family protein [Clostridium sp. 'White wine YQ']|uniref:NAD-dependent epimerase/dehydratase family protein n=1 Tax=Clostridium sp. 'White wine YQ' TaxID=3027474 RepID=UPI0023663230|nr:NAD(P)H-binding protein [Clostridium sp. 'White wine YQ']MDD7792769.1 NAD(P)H-binding protein [Clostridium sp. 'White wine YQ']
MVLVTGITGHSGRYFLQELIDNKYEGNIRCIVRETSDTSMLDSSPLKIENVVGDITDEVFLNKCMKDVDTVVHIVNIRHTLRIIKAAINNKVPRAICVHTTGIYSKFRGASEEYKIIDKELSEMIRGSDIKITVLQPTMIYGDICDHNMSRFIKMIDRFRLFPVINHGKCLIQPVNARDLGKAYYQVFMMPKDKAKTIYNLSGEKPITVIDAFRLISKNLGKKTVFISFPLWGGVLLARILKMVTLGKVDYIEKVQRMSEDRCFSHEDAKIDFEYRPESFEIGIEREVKAYLNR